MAQPPLKLSVRVSPSKRYRYGPPAPAFMTFGTFAMMLLLVINVSVAS